MAVNFQKPKIFILMTLSSACLIGGLGAAFVLNEYAFVHWVLAGVGFAGFLSCSITLLRCRPETSKGRNWRNFYYVIFLSVLFLSFTVLVNYLAYSYNIRYDLTRFKQHTLSDQTKTLVEHLDTSVQITVFHVGIPPKYVEDLLREYELAARGKIQAEIIDPIVQIGYAAKFGNLISGKEKKAIVQAGDERRDIDFTDDLLTEDLINNAIIRITRKARYVYFLTGHGEYNMFSDEDTGLNKLVRLLLANNIISKRLLLELLDAVPEECDLLVIAGPQKDLSKKEINLIDEYLKDGGDALFLIEHTVVTEQTKPLTPEQEKKNPALNEILNEWGLSVAYDIVVDLASHASGDVGSPATKNYPEHKAIVRGLDYTFYIRPRSITPVKGRRKTLKLAPLVLTQSGNSSWGETNRALDVKFDEGVDTPGPVAIAYIAWEPKEKEEVSDTRLIVFTDADFLSNLYINHYSNAEMALNAVNWLTESDYQVFVDKKDIKVQQLDLTSQQKRLVLLVLIMMPLTIIFAGGMFWLYKY